MDPVSDAARLEQLRTGISPRLRRVCAHLSDEQFAGLVDDIARVTLKYEERPRLSPPVAIERAGQRNR
jgi:hypothetical protein